MSYSEFPHTNYEDTDFHELIALYKKVSDEYHGTLEQINSVSKRLDDYQMSMNAVIREQVDSAVKSAMVTYSSTIETRLNELNTAINNLNNQLNSYNNTYDAAIKKLMESITSEEIDRKAADNLLSEQVNNINNRVNTIYSDVATELSKERAHLDSELSKLREEVDETFELYLKTAVSTATMYTANQIEALDSKLSARIDEISTQSGHAAIRWLWQYGCYHGGFSAIQWYYLTQISAECFDETGITANEWYVIAKEVFEEFDNRNKMFSPVSGKFVDVKVALMELAVALNIGSMTAEEYENLGLTADEYERFRITAGNYDWHGKEILDV